MTIAGGIRAARARGGERIALEAGAEQRTYGQLVDRIDRISSVARAHYRLEPGDRVALIAPNRIDYVELVAGFADAGIIVATLNPRLAGPELAAIIADCTPRLVLIDDAVAQKIASSLEGGIPLVWLDRDFAGLVEQAKPLVSVPLAEQSPFALAYTSGTTGQPKGVLLSHRSRALTFQSMAAEYRCFGVDDRFLSVTPMCHGAGFVFACAALFYGGTTVLFDGGDPEALLRRITAGDVTGVFMVPTHFARLYDLPQPMLDRHRDHNLATIISNAAALPQAAKARTVDHFGAGLLHETYGSTEGGIVTNIRPGDILRKPGSVGHPFPLMEVELRRPDGTIADPGEHGELFCRGPTLFNGYWNRRDATQEALVDGWVTVGDIGSRDDEGFITIMDRKKDMVVTGGVNVYPREIENVIGSVPGVSEVAVVGQPSQEWGESLHAFVVASSGAEANADRIIGACRASLAGFKVPKHISFIDELPRNTGGKVLKSVLRERLL